MSKGRNEHSAAKVVAIIMGFMALTALVVFRSGIVQTVFDSKPDYSRELVKAVSIRGTVKQDDLKLSSGEIKTINNVALKYRKQFTKVNLNFNYAAKEGPREVKPDTPLVMDIMLDLSDGAQIRSWSKKLPRRKVVPDMVDYINKAASELERYKKLEGDKPFKRFYL